MDTNNFFPGRADSAALRFSDSFFVMISKAHTLSVCNGTTEQINYFFHFLFLIVVRNPKFQIFHLCNLSLFSSQYFPWRQFLHACPFLFLLKSTQSFLHCPPS